eukprot:CAMPEP_0170404480 /NCGR_PEP_ID=MMETSP0117_2-20130122/26658_1 /TAXON_ID=400756 /ORGANISM="Durinskia baltica, Strain CSIRO CS-38" /LENGTH=39 /DNA_ID= /DNA_START= /DNA_END= /DNA_ORIENTATION=
MWPLSTQRAAFCGAAANPVRCGTTRFATHTDCDAADAKP